MVLVPWPGDGRAVIAPTGKRAYELAVAANVLGVRTTEAVRRRTKSAEPLTSWRVPVGKQTRLLVSADEVDDLAMRRSASLRASHDLVTLAKQVANLAEAVEALRREVSDLRGVQAARTQDEVERLKAVAANHRKIEALHRDNEALLTDELPNN